MVIGNSWKGQLGISREREALLHSIQHFCRSPLAARGIISEIIADLTQGGVRLDGAGAVEGRGKVGEAGGWHVPP